MAITGQSAAEIVDSVRAEVRSGALEPGQALPPVRELAARLGVNRNTVAAAYKRLVVVGVAETRGRLGTLIREPAAPGPREGAAPDSPLMDLASGNPDPRWLPDPRALAAALSGQPRLYGEPSVSPRLAALAEPWFRDVPCPDPVLTVTHGAVDAIERLLTAHLVPADPVAVEDPCFLSSIHTLRLLGLRPMGVPVDGEGMTVDGLRQALASGARAVLCTPRAHNPTGCNLSAGRAAALRQVLAEYPDVLVIEDDHFAPLSRAEYQPLASSRSRHWAVVRSVSKCFGPDLRLALVVSDEDSASRLGQRLASGTAWVSHLLQDMVALCLESSAVMARVTEAAADYRRRRDTLSRALRDQGLCPWDGDGLNLWIPLPGPAAPVTAALARRGWLVRDDRPFRLGAGAGALRVTVTGLEPEVARHFSADLARVLAAG
ncbi:transcriptional regulator PtsJ [Alloalcanivorax xenomutans]|uniref:MocR-like B6 salvage transcription factor PtsJ n=1 Tax=Alloalcanivorax xenomutans TaxID=1094342 RepID=UPI003A806E53